VRTWYTLGLLLLSNVFMTLAWYGHLKWFPASRSLQLKALFQLKVLQEVLSLTVFAVFAIYIDPQHTFRWNHAAACCCLLGAVYFIFQNQ